MLINAQCNHICWQIEAKDVFFFQDQWYTVHADITFIVAFRIYKKTRLQKWVELRDGDSDSSLRSRPYGPISILGQSNVLTDVWLSGGGGWGFPACITGHMTRGVCIQGAGGSASGVGMGVCQAGCGGGRLGRPPPARTRKAGGMHPMLFFSISCILQKYWQI